jgi:glycosyltransferase involved in cell wall biosynthesis
MAIPELAGNPGVHRAQRAGGSPADVTHRTPVSVVMPVLNEAAGLRRAITRLKWADEVIVVDGGSTDESATIARRAGASVLVVKNRTIAAQRNAGIAAARNRWILALDADEEVTPELRTSLAQLCQSADPAPAAFRVRSRNWHLGRELGHGPWGRDWKVRVFTRDQRFVERRVHEHLDAPEQVGNIDGALIHHPYRDLAHQVSKVGTYARWASQDLRDRGRRARLPDLFVRPAWRFVRDFVVLGGWRDGTAGFVVTTVSAFSVFLKYACLMMPPDTSGHDRDTR